MSWWLGLLLLVVTVVVVTVLKNLFPWLPAIGIAAGLAYGIGTHVRRKDRT